jgi:hypothetical protein
MTRSTRTLEPKVKRSTPETLRQAQTWDANASRYRTAGFCDACASQASWGHQLGFTNAKPVCDACRGREVPTESARAQRWSDGSSVE